MPPVTLPKFAPLSRALVRPLAANLLRGAAGGGGAVPAPPPPLTFPGSILPGSATYGVVSDAVRLAADEGDGLAPPQSMMTIYSGTNWAINGSLETNAAGYVAILGAETVARVTTDKKFGGACLSVVRNSVDPAAGAKLVMTLSATTVHQISGWVKSLDANPGVVEVALDATPTTILGTASMGATAGAWTRFLLTFTSTTGAPYRISFRGADFLLDGIQVEEGATLSPFMRTNGGAVTKSGGCVRAPSSLFTTAQGWVALRMISRTSSYTFPRYAWHFGGFPEMYFVLQSATQIRVHRDGLTNFLNVPAGQQPYFNNGQTLVAVFAWTPTQTKVSINAQPFTVGANANVPVITDTTSDIGNQSSGSQSALAGDVLAAAFGSGLLLDADLAAISAALAADDALTDRSTLPGACTGFYNMKDLTGV